MGYLSKLIACLHDHAWDRLAGAGGSISSPSAADAVAKSSVAPPECALTVSLDTSAGSALTPFIRTTDNRKELRKRYRPPHLPCERTEGPTTGPAPSTSESARPPAPHIPNCLLRASSTSLISGLCHHPCCHPYCIRHSALSATSTLTVPGSKPYVPRLTAPPALRLPSAPHSSGSK